MEKYYFNKNGIFLFFVKGFEINKLLGDKYKQ